MRSYAVTHPRGTVVPPQPPGWDQLVYAADGVMTVVVADGRWVVPPTRAVWLPDGSVHRMEVEARARVRNLYLAVGLAPVHDRARAVDVPPLVRELVLRCVALAPLYADDSRHVRLVGVLLDELAPLRDAPLHLPMPADDRARRVAEVLLVEPGTTTTLDELARSVGSSRRTIERSFRRETGLSLGRWRGHARLLAALRLLAAGSSSTQVAAAIGYGSTSSFVAAFRRHFATTPSRYFGR